MKIESDKMPSRQENSDSAAKLTKKIEVIRAEDFWSPPDECEYYDQEMIVDAEKYAEEEQQKIEPLPYSPFDPKIELRNIRKLSAKERALPNEEKRKVRAERLASFKECLISQKEGIAKVIGELREAVESAPDISAENLLLKVLEFAPKYRFTRDQIGLFKYAVEEYREKHNAVEKYRALYSNDADLFNACFGKPPEGKIEVVKGPMTLFFRCFNVHDYVFAYSFPRHQGDEAKVRREDIAMANSSNGTAIGMVKISELWGVVALENVFANSHNHKIIKGAEQVKEIRDGKEIQLYIIKQRGDVYVEVNGVGIWKIKMAGRSNDDGFPTRIKLLNFNEFNKADAPPIFDFRILLINDKNLSDALKLESVDDGKLLSSATQHLTVGGKTYGSVYIDPISLTIKDQSADGITIRYREDVLVEVTQEKASETVRTHEEQHQFNKLFQPFWAREDNWTMMKNAVERAATPEGAVNNLIYGFVKLERKYMNFDSRARDEILAYCKDGRNANDIFTILTGSKLYDYVREYEEKISTIPSIVKSDMRREISKVLYEFVDGVATAVDAQALEIDESDVMPYINLVFKEEYAADLKKWIGSISVLEKKGYTRDEIVNILYQEPTDSWPNLVRRIGPKTKP